MKFTNQPIWHNKYLKLIGVIIANKMLKIRVWIKVTI